MDSIPSTLIGQVPGSVVPHEANGNDRLSIASSPHHLLPEGAVHACLGLFFQRHFATDFCCFDIRVVFEGKCHQNESLAFAIVALCVRYLTLESVQDLFGQPDPKYVERHYLRAARERFKLVSDEPSIINVQTGLVLALAELLASNGLQYWMTTGIAIRMAQYMRLNKEYNEGVTVQMQEIRRRVFWSCWVFDRTSAYLLNKPRTLSLANVAIALPNTEAALVHHEVTKGWTLDDFHKMNARMSETGMTPYYLKAVSLWSDLADFSVCRRRLRDNLPPTEPRSAFYKLNGELSQWYNALEPTISWSVPNFEMQRHLGQGSLFLATHLLSRSAVCVGHQCYLPHLDNYTVLSGSIDAAGWSYLHREESLIEACISNALSVGEILTWAVAAQVFQDHNDHLQRLWAAKSILSIVRSLLWIRHATDPKVSETMQGLAVKYLDVISRLLSSWIGQWKVAKQWLSIVEALSALCNAAYLGDIDESLLAPQAPNESPDEDASKQFYPRPGNGQRSTINDPNLLSSLDLAGCDTTSKHRDLQSIWWQLTGGWPFRVSLEAYTDDDQTIDPSIFE
ncbi:unnamed protein product [Clonostachys byssicola]|uniref:Xylanolytic transcriptional activator regulatory domain-containing protein n=1 Tax=Clonostachys byssicola TaxID=160290 RepID=A0A9N9U3L3_9HYPO|nr:unnamed protein product [Clonostachys byssicola]